MKLFHVDIGACCYKYYVGIILVTPIFFNLTGHLNMMIITVYSFSLICILKLY